MKRGLVFLVLVFLVSVGLVYAVPIPGHAGIEICDNNLCVSPPGYSGKVGIGTQTPAVKLDVNGYVKGTQLCIGSDCKNAWPAPGLWSTNANGIDYNNGNVGIGIAIPTVKLDVAGNIKGTIVEGGTVKGTNELCIGSDCRGVWPAAGGSVWDQNGAKIYYDTLNGKVGIGTSDPASELDVKGNVRIKYIAGSQGMALEDSAGISTLRFDSDKFRIYEGKGGIGNENELLSINADTKKVTATGDVCTTGVNGVWINELCLSKGIDVAVDGAYPRESCEPASCVAEDQSAASGILKKDCDDGMIPITCGGDARATGGTGSDKRLKRFSIEPFYGTGAGAKSGCKIEWISSATGGTPSTEAVVKAYCVKANLQ